MIDHNLQQDLIRAGYVKHGNTNTLPTLSELIDACGDDFTKLLRCRVIQPGTEGATYMFRAIDSNGLSTELCKTPEEAVARLFIAINKEEDV